MIFENSKITSSKHFISACVYFVASQAPAGIRSSGGVTGHRFIGHGQLGGRMGRHHSGTVEALVLFVFVVPP